jgi:hypothetical protein
MEKIDYRSLKRYKYQLLGDYSIQLAIIPEKGVETPFVTLMKSGHLTIKKGYAWDGPSGPTFDTPSFMRGSLVHDVLYQLLRMGAFPSYEKEYADNLLREQCIEDGMPKIRAFWVYWGVRVFGRSSSDYKQ